MFLYDGSISNVTTVLRHTRLQRVSFYLCCDFRLVIIESARTDLLLERSCINLACPYDTSPSSHLQPLSSKKIPSSFSTPDRGTRTARKSSLSAHTILRALSQDVH